VLVQVPVVVVVIVACSVLVKVDVYVVVYVLVKVSVVVLVVELLVIVEVPVIVVVPVICLKTLRGTSSGPYLPAAPPSSVRTKKWWCVRETPGKLKVCACPGWIKAPSGFEYLRTPSTYMETTLDSPEPRFLTVTKAAPSGEKAIISTIGLS
jgi:hypothetical protein